jgi:hypothetical protein
MTQAGYCEHLLAFSKSEVATVVENRQDAGQGGSVHTDSIQRRNSWRAAEAWVASSCQPASMDKRLA